jgi:hypothetical protein
LAGYCWIVQYGLQSNLVDWIEIDNQTQNWILDLDYQSILKSGFGFGLTITYL